MPTPAPPFVSPDPTGAAPVPDPAPGVAPDAGVDAGAGAGADAGAEVAPAAGPRATGGVAADRGGDGDSGCKPDRDSAATTGSEAPDPRTEQEPPGPMRRCILTRAVHRRDEMLRFVLDPEGRIAPDIDARLPGRGFWLSPRPDVVETAAAKGAFARAAKRSVQVPPDLPAQVDRLLEDRIVNLLGLARKAGQAVVGFEKTRSWIRQGRAAWVLEAWDMADGSEGSLGAAADLVPIYRALDRLALGRGFARSQGVHAAIAPGGLGTRLQTDLIRLGRLRGRLMREDTPPASGASTRPRGTPRSARKTRATAADGPAMSPGAARSPGDPPAIAPGPGGAQTTRSDPTAPQGRGRTNRTTDRRKAHKADTGGLPDASRKPG